MLLSQCIKERSRVWGLGLVVQASSSGTSLPGTDGGFNNCCRQWRFP